MHARYLAATFESDCSRCTHTMFPPVRGFFHDVACWGWRTAFFNVGVRIKLALGMERI